jgi:16S rRNA A1518/A1519 N6-dimethyltransferase RsmA/KsgA/DIM1 with predicted DNA glycosylase/AP lyase activity
MCRRRRSIPSPRVHSAVVRLIPRPAAELSAHDEKQFAALVSAAFAQRRKMLRNSLRGLVDDARLEALGVSPTCRAEDLSVDDYSAWPMQWPEIKTAFPQRHAVGWQPWNRFSPPS